jgi:phosphohistidine phosphatase SixA
MRHASSPREVPTTQTANADNVKLERQLDEAGRAGAVAIGRALCDLKIPVGEVLTSNDIPRARDGAAGSIGEFAIDRRAR